MHKKGFLFIVIPCMILFLAGCNKVVYQLQVLYDKQPVRSFTIQEIKSMPSTSLMVDGENQSGTSIATLLKFAGIQTYAKVSVMNEAFELYDLFSEQNLENFILITSRRNVKLISKNMAKKDWINGITTIAASSIP